MTLIYARRNAPAKQMFAAEIAMDWPPAIAALVMDRLALAKIQRTPDCFLKSAIDNYIRYSEPVARRLIWC